MKYLQRILVELLSNIFHNHKDNWDVYRYGKHNDKSITSKQKFIGLLDKKQSYRAIRWFKYLYNNLEYEADKRLLVKVLAYRMLGYTKVKLPLNNTGYWKKLKELEKLTNKADLIQSGFLDIPLTKFNINKIGFPIEFYLTELGIMIDFIVKQYEYNKNGKIIKANKGDMLIDGGGCWGDTALFFSNEVGASGKVYTFEFIPHNLRIMRKNFSLNRELEKNIEIVEKPLWNKTDTTLFYQDFGPGSNVRSERFKEMSGECVTINIDTLVADKNLDKVDFIKMDIEGAETEALHGAAKTIKKFKPKLAITLYHSIEDFEHIPKIIKEFVPEYKFYFSHCTIYSEESLLFAQIDQ